MGIQRLILQMDNQACIEAIKNADHQGGECYHILNNCRRLISLLGSNFHIVHCFREGNRVADRLANIGVNLEMRKVYYDVPPHDIALLIQEDIIGMAYPRLVA